MSHLNRKRHLWAVIFLGKVSRPTSTRTDQVEQAFHQLHITEPALLARAAVIDDAVRDLITEATTKTQGRDAVSGPGLHRTTGTAPDLRHLAHLAAKEMLRHLPLVLAVDLPSSPSRSGRA